MSFHRKEKRDFRSKKTSSISSRHVKVKWISEQQRKSLWIDKVHLVAMSWRKTIPCQLTFLKMMLKEKSEWIQRKWIFHRSHLSAWFNWIRWYFCSNKTYFLWNQAVLVNLASISTTDVLSNHKLFYFCASKNEYSDVSARYWNYEQRCLLWGMSYVIIVDFLKLSIDHSQ